MGWLFYVFVVVFVVNFKAVLKCILGTEPTLAPAAVLPLAAYKWQLTTMT